jgi:hypothetical protein
VSEAVQPDLAPGPPGRAAGLAERWRRLSRSHLRTGLVALGGAAIGAAYAHFIGCRTGTCPLTSSVWTASLYGAVVGSVIGWPDRRKPGGPTGDRAQRA